MLGRDARPGEWPVYWPMLYDALQDLSRWLYWRREVRVRDESVHIWHFMFPVDQDLFKGTPLSPPWWLWTVSWQNWQLPRLPDPICCSVFLHSSLPVAGAARASGPPWMLKAAQAKHKDKALRTEESKRVWWRRWVVMLDTYGPGVLRKNIDTWVLKWRYCLTFIS